MNSKILMQSPLENLVESKVENPPATPSEQLPKLTEEKAVVPKRRSHKKYFDYSNFAGTKVNSLTAVKPSHPKNGKKYIVWEFLCDCGNTAICVASAVVSGTTKTCGCSRLTHKEHQYIRHGMTGSKEYRAWQGMFSRCHNSKNLRYKDYGGRGIEVCENWRYSFNNFFSDMGLAPTKNHSIDRINVDGNYCHENCRWATWSEQYSNRRDNLRITYHGVCKSVHEWAAELGMTHHCLRTRIKRGWSLERAFTEPARIKAA